MVRNIIRDDEGKLNVDPKAEQLIQFLRENNNEDMAISLENKVISHPMKNQSFHYIPYKTDSNFEQVFLEEILKLSIIKEKGLEVYYNGDKALTEFKIKCYKRKGKAFQYIGMYTPDFLIISRKGERIYKALIIETKGKIYANDPMFKDKKEFVEKVFKDKNNLKFQYDRFEYLYLEDSLTTNERLGQVDDIIKKFMNETFHIENDYLFQLNPCEYEIIPEYLIEQCNKNILEIKTLSSKVCKLPGNISCLNRQFLPFHIQHLKFAFIFRLLFRKFLQFRHIRTDVRFTHQLINLLITCLKHLNPLLTFAKIVFSFAFSGGELFLRFPALLRIRYSVHETVISSRMNGWMSHNVLVSAYILGTVF